MLPLLTERLVVKAQVETMDRCLPQENFKHPSMKSIQEVAVCCSNHLLKAKFLSIQVWTAAA